MSQYADVILPLALPKRSYTYAVPEELAAELMVGMRVEVPFGKSKLYSGLIERVHHEKPDYATKPILGVLDEFAVVSPNQLKLWEWLAAYYAATMGEVMQAAMPGHLKLSSETKLVFQSEYGEDFSGLSDQEYLIAEALLMHRELKVDDARKILNKKTVFPAVQSLLKKGVLALREDLQEKFKPKKVLAVQWAQLYFEQPELLQEALKTVESNERQHDMLLAFYALQQRQTLVRRSELLRKTGAASDSALKSLVKKGILELVALEQSRIKSVDAEESEAEPLSPQQTGALQRIRAHFAHLQTVLLHGVTGSGKTRVYLELIREVMQKGGQVLYLMPEIALTTHLTARLQRVLGSNAIVYHSKVNYNERVEIWRAAASGRPVIVSARSGLFLPFSNLQLVVVDEEHDPSYKQFDPAPRYHARDAAIYLAKEYGAKVLLGTATPSLESWKNAVDGKYGLVAMPERFGAAPLPQMQIIDLRQEIKNKRLHGPFSTLLLDAMKQAIQNGEQAILFQNRRGYAPLLTCESCGWNAQCRYCDVSLTYHKLAQRLRCHYCGFEESPPSQCPACGSAKLTQIGFGTERIEDDLRLHLPDARIARLDLDTASSKSRLATLLHDFEDRQIDILIGTQMVTKGLDFDNVALVGVLSADQSLRFPEFRAHERTFQLITQVAGRAGRRDKRGLVLIQAWNPEHPVLKDVLYGNFQGFVSRELHERALFRYPPFFRLIHLTVRHAEDQVARDAADWMAAPLRRFLGERLLGPTVPGIPRVRGMFAREMLIKLDKTADLLEKTKTGLMKLSEELVAQPGWSGVRISVDVDPY